MAVPFRNGRAISQVIHFLSTPSCRLPLRTNQSLRLPALTLSRGNRLFSVTSTFRQQATEAQANPGQDQPQQYTKFQELADNGLVSPVVIKQITQGMNIHTMTDVQRMTINECLDGADVIAQAKTGTGKTIAFLMPIVQRILRDPSLETRTRARARPDDIRALIISPTRELAEQIAVEAKKIVRGTAVKVQTAVGGSQKSYHLRLMQQEGCHILVGTPGRVQDILSDGYSGVSLENIETFVLDEADRLLDIGFAPAIEEIQSFMPAREDKSRQTLMLSATVPPAVVSLVRRILRPDFKFVRTVSPDDAPTHANVPQTVTFLRGLENQLPALVELTRNALAQHQADAANNMPFKAIVYMNSTSEVALARNILTSMMSPDADSNSRSRFSNGPLHPCEIMEMHSKLSQSERTRNSERFRRAQSALLLSSDVTARGMDFPNVSHVIQIGLPRSEEDYIHRLGRTGRAGKSGQGMLLLQKDEKWNFQRMLGRGGFNIKVDESIPSAEVDMTQSAQLPKNVADTLRMVESGVRRTPDQVKRQAFMSMLGPLAGGGRDKQTVVDLLLNLAKYGWGMQESPMVSPTLLQKLGLARTTGFRVGHDRERGDMSDRGGFGGSGGFGSRGRSTSDDPFGDSGRGGGRGGFGSSGGYGRSGSSSGGFGRGGSSSGGFGRGASRGGGFDRQSGRSGFGSDRGGQY